MIEITFYWYQFFKTFTLNYGIKASGRNIPGAFDVPKRHRLWAYNIKLFNFLILLIILFLTFDYLENKLDLSSESDKYKDFRFVKWLSKNVKLQGIPFSAFYSEKDKYMAENYLRFCFFKVNTWIFILYVMSININFVLQKDDTLEKADNILTTWTNSLSKTIKSKF